MMTTLHGLVTISELFAGFNLINTGVVTCLIMQNAPFQDKKIQKKFPNPTSRGVCGASTCPQTKILDPPVLAMFDVTCKTSLTTNLQPLFDIPKIASRTIRRAYLDSVLARVTAACNATFWNVEKRRH